MAKEVHGRGSMCGRSGACVAGEMATAADSTHPTGMHSCEHMSSYIPINVNSIVKQNQLTSITPSTRKPETCFRIQTSMFTEWIHTMMHCHVHF